MWTAASARRQAFPPTRSDALHLNKKWPLALTHQALKALFLIAPCPAGLAWPCWRWPPCQAPATEAPALLLAQVSRPGLPLQDYWVSEKYDGVRGYWDGRTLRTRGGTTVAAPVWFTTGWPDTPMDGELWAGRGRFVHAQSTTRQQQPDEAAWRQMRFMVFDLPTHGGTFDERLPTLQALVARLGQPWVQASQT